MIFIMADTETEHMETNGQMDRQTAKGEEIRGEFPFFQFPTHFQYSSAVRDKRVYRNNVPRGA